MIIDNKLLECDGSLVICGRRITDYATEVKTEVKQCKMLRILKTLLHVKNKVDRNEKIKVFLKKNSKDYEFVKNLMLKHASISYFNIKDSVCFKESISKLEFNSASVVMTGNCRTFTFYAV